MGNRQLFVHMPLPYYNSDQLIRTLIAAREFYRRAGLNVPAPDIYRSYVNNIMFKMQSIDPKGSQAKDIKHMLFGHGCERAIISIPIAFDPKSDVVNEQGLLPKLEAAVGRIVQVFDDCEIVLFFGLVNPGDLVSTLTKARVVSEEMWRENFPTHGWFWSDAIGGCMDVYPGIKVVAWRHDSAYFLWPRILRKVSSISDDILLPGCLDMIAHSITDDGIRKLYSFLHGSPRKDDDYVVLALREHYKRFRRNRVIMKRVRLPIWSKWISGFFERDYEEDLAILENEPQVEFIPHSPSKPLISLS